MKSYISAIVIFSNKGEKRFVDFKQGVNIITGDSKKGKSALVEIIDYCLCSSRCTIPKGRITEFGHLYCLLLVVGNKCLVIARDSWERGNKMYISAEKADFSVDELDYKYFESKSALPPKEVQFEIEQSIGLQVSNLETDADDKKSKKASLRNMVSYMFQHQNLMASKFALFYRFNDYYKRLDIIEQFPVFAGIIGQEYYTSLIRLNTLKKELKKLQKTEVQNSVIDQKIRDGLLPLFKDYYALVNSPFDESKTTKQLVKLSAKLPELDLSQFSSKDIIERYNKLNEELEILRDKESELILKIKDLININSVGNSYIEILEELQEKTQISKPDKEAYTCPLCDNYCEGINKLKIDILEASKWLDREMKIATSYSNNFLEDMRKLESEKDVVVQKIKEIYKQIKHIERSYLKSEKLTKLQEKISDAKVRIQFYIETLREGMFKDVNAEIEEIKDQIRLLDEKIGSFDVPNKINKAKFKICENMNKLAETLDFENEFRPVNLTFEIDTFDYYHYNEKKREKIFLSEMGSGANWVSCHISLFLSFLRFFTEQKEKSPMPLILFFDQPSQVYFPQGTKEIPDNDEDGIENVKKQKDIEAVNKIYKTIFDEVISIGKDTGIIPQVIIVDHVDGEDLEVRETFRQCTRRNWRDVEALI